MATTLHPRRDGLWLLHGAAELLTYPDVTEVTGRDRSTIEHLVDSGVLPAVRLGKRTFIPRAAVLRLVGLPAPGDPDFPRRD